MNLYLPDTVTAGEHVIDIRTDYRDVLTVFEAYEDPNLSDEDKTEAMIRIMFPEPEQIRCLTPEEQKEAVRGVLSFISGGRSPDEKKQGGPRLLSWTQDIEYIIAPVNRIIGQDVRAMDHLHWWTFLSAFREIGGEATLSQILQIRKKKIRGQKMEKWEKEWYQQNRDAVDLKTVYTDRENEFLKIWTGSDMNDTRDQD